MSLTFHLRAVCSECGGPLTGFKTSWGCRVNLGSIRTKGSIGAVRPCPECGFDPRRACQSDWLMYLDADSQSKVDAARDKIRSRRKDGSIR